MRYNDIKKQQETNAEKLHREAEERLEAARNQLRELQSQIRPKIGVRQVIKIGGKKTGMKEQIRDYVSRIAYGKSLEDMKQIYEKAWEASLETENEGELIKKILEISREYNT